MAGKPEVERTYSPLDFVFRRSLGPTGDYSGALFNGDFSLSLEEAQRNKHRRIVESLQLGPGDRVIDLGCGWGGFLAYAERSGLSGTGVTLSSRQVKACRGRGLQVFERDCRKVCRDEFGEFDGVVSLGAFEHFCTVAEGRTEAQERVYRDFFINTATLLPVGRRFFLQTMVFGPKMIDYDAVSLRSPRDSDSYALALMEWGNPGSWLPSSLEQVVACAAPAFRLVSSESGRVDYIETLARWSAAFRRFDLPKYLAYLAMAPRLAATGSLRRYLDFLRINPNRVCFQRELMEHYRIVFERVA